MAGSELAGVGVNADIPGSGGSRDSATLLKSNMTGRALLEKNQYRSQDRQSWKQGLGLAQSNGRPRVDGGAGQNPGK